VECQNLKKKFRDNIQLDYTTFTSSKFFEILFSTMPK